MKISRNHKNRKAHNWLVYDIVDAFLKKNVDLYNGIIYDLGAGEATYKDFFLQYGDEYISVDWLNSLSHMVCSEKNQRALHVSTIAMAPGLLYCPQALRFDVPRRAWFAVRTDVPSPIAKSPNPRPRTRLAGAS